MNTDQRCYERNIGTFFRVDPYTPSGEGSTATDQDHTKFVRRDENGDCKPPDSDKYVKWRGSDGSHWHWITWNQDPDDCMAYPDYKSGPDPDPKYSEIPR